MIQTASIIAWLPGAIVLLVVSLQTPGALRLQPFVDSLPVVLVPLAAFWLLLAAYPWLNALLPLFS